MDQRSSDHAYYAAYTGNANTLYPMLNGNVNTAVGARRDLASLLSGSHEVKSTASLGNEALRAASGTMASSVEEVLANKLP
jgi:hypothetical protein